ncbi:hypothetical protein PMNALOAF_4110 [Methylobacterium adhaesivum]|nr:hypothetical protein PMNALOAF_4110 [Methylobacterium adhaesivum]
MYWSYTFEDLIRLTDLKVQFEMVKAMSFTESLLFTAGQVFGAKQSAPTEDLNSVSDMLAFAAQING